MQQTPAKRPRIDPPTTSRLTTALLHVPFVSSASVPNWGEQTPNLERQRKTMYWLVYHLRLVNHAFFIDPPTFQPTLLSFALLTPRIHSNVTRDFLCPTRLNTVQREARVLDVFIAIETREDLFTHASELHLGRCKLFKDLFDLMQPRSHIENLVRHYGMGEGLVHITSTSAIGSSTITSLDSMASRSSRS
ncbi:hypothetical protein EDC04DRAFT_3091545 [Pisolithus marmoratus]|nr:hypothetical protein EDC04DRAFT_3091545 [Pisolithus marmoratus]